MPHRLTAAEADGATVAVPGKRLRRSREVVLRRSADISFVVTLAIVAVMWLLPVPYLVQTPGPVVNVLGEEDGQPAITISGAEDHAPSGQLDLLTVGVAGGPGRDLGALPVLQAWLSSQDTVVPAEMYYPIGTSRDAVTAENAARMSSSQELAVAAALTQLGIDYGQRAVIAGVAAGMPADGELQEGDAITAIDGTAITEATQVVEAVGAWQAGDGPLALAVDRDDTQLQIELTPSGEPARIGATLADEFDFPIDVQFHIGDIGGPSAGLIFTLAIIDHLTEGELTGGAHIAGTGEISVDGTVGAIGGARQKAFAAHERGAAYFLSPAGNCQEVAQAVTEGELDDMRVIRVETLDDAVSSLEAIADSETTGLPECSTTD